MRSVIVVLCLVLSACGTEGTTVAAARNETPRAHPGNRSTARVVVDVASATPTAGPTLRPSTPIPAIPKELSGAPATVAPAAPAVAGASVAGCPLFPQDNPWRRDVSSDPVDARSDAYIAAISDGGARNFLHADFGSDPTYGIPFVTVPRDQKKVPIRYTDYGDESDPGPFPIPLNAKREAGSDHHVIAVQKGTCKLFELFNARRTSNGWAASSGARFDLTSNALRPAGWTSADAAGLPILPGLVRRSETSAGAILHALRFTAPRTQRGYVHPARHFASDSTDPNLPPMGLRLRLKASYDISRFTGHSRVILQALKTYGMLLADNGSSWFISGQNDTSWNDDDLNQLKGVPGSAFEAIQHGTIHE